MANDIKIGNVGIGGVYIGSSSASSVYLGSTLVWSVTPLAPKWIATYLGGTTSSAQCDSSSAITKNEISKVDLIEVEIGDCVTSIGNNAFSGYSSLTSVTIGSGVTSIGEWAFYQCSGLTSLTIPDSVTSIGNGALSRCSGLTSVTIGSGVTRINQSSFQFCSSLTSITIEAATPPTLSDTSVFFNTNNCPIYVPAESVSAYKAATNWSAYASRIQAIPSPTPTGSTCYEVISTPITSYTSTTYDSVCSFDDVKWYMKNNLSQYEEYGVYDDSGSSLSDYTYYDGKLVAIGTTEYQRSGNTWVEVGTYESTETTYTIDNTSPSPYVGQEISTTFKIPYNDVGGWLSFSIGTSDGDLMITLTTGGYTEYSYNSYVGTVTNDGEYFYLSLPSEAPQSIVIQNINYWNSTPIHLIAGTKQVTVEYDEKVMPLAQVYSTVADMELVGCPTVGVGQYGVVGDSAYQFTNNEEWDAVSNVKFFAIYSGGSANVIGCNSSSELSSVETQPSYLKASAMTNAVIGDCVTSIGEMAFNFCSGLTSINIPDSVTSIGNQSFRNCSGLTSVTMGSSVTSIGSYAFQYCSSLSSVTIPSGVTTIGSAAFGGCSNLTSITLNSNTIVSNTYSTSSSIKNIFGSQVREYIIGDSVTSIGSYAFYQCGNLSSVTIPNSVTLVMKNAFNNCSGLTSIGGIGSGASVEIPNSVTSIGSNAFNGCSGLSSVTIPNSVTDIGAGAFSYCSGLRSVTIGNGLSYINKQTFYGCGSLTSVTIGSSVTSIGASAFYNCSGLTSVTVNATTPPTLGNTNAFANTNNCPIYVPCESVATYKAASIWSTYASRIEGIPPCVETYEGNYGD